MDFESKVGFSVIGVWLFGALVSFAVWVGLVWAAIHFVHKFW